MRWQQTAARRVDARTGHEPVRGVDARPGHEPVPPYEPPPARCAGALGALPSAWGRGPRTATLGALALGVGLAIAGGCTRAGTPRPLNAAPASLSAGPVTRGPAPPTRGLPIPSLDVAWTPPMVTAGDVEALAAALSGHEHAVVRLGARLSQDSRGESLVRALQPKVERIEGTTGGLRPMVARGELPLRRSQDEGRPRYVFDDLAVDASSLQKVASTIPDASVLVALDDASVDPRTWQSLPAHTVGSCEAPLFALAEGQERALAQLEPFLDHADAVLAQTFRAELRAILPAMREELAPFAAARARAEGEPLETWQAQQCGQAYHRFVEAYAPCETGKRACAYAPRLVLVAGARVGAAEPDVFIPRECGSKAARDYVAAIREAGREAARVTADHLDASWIALADRLGTVTEVHAALEDVCAPRRRRFADEDLQTARERLAAIGVALGSDDLRDPAASWVLEPDRFHVPGVGPVQQHARYDAGPGSPSRKVVSESRALRQFVLSRARCRGEAGKLPLAALVVDVEQMRASFFGYFYEEELFCAELPPLRDPAPSDGQRDTTR